MEREIASFVEIIMLDIQVKSDFISCLNFKNKLSEYNLTERMKELIDW